jgi:RNA polymerase sigma-70 factor, ECF subfamily
VEEALLRKVIDKDSGAIEALYDTFAPVLLSLCLRYCGNRDDAEDILHDGFMKIIRKIDTFRARPDATMEGWMRRIMVNTALNFLRSKARMKNMLSLDSSADSLPDPVEEPDGFGDILARVDKAKLMDMICDLPAGYRTVFNMYVFDEYGHREIAEMLGCSENTSKSQLSKARALLRKRIMDMVHFKPVESYEKV